MTKHPFDITHLYDHAISNSHRAHSMHRNSNGHKQVVLRLGIMDKHIHKKYPHLRRTSLQRKYLTWIGLAENLGGSDRYLKDQGVVIK